MHPEVQKHIHKYVLSQESTAQMELPKKGPIGDSFTQYKDGIIKRSTWLLDFTDKHPLFYGQNPKDIEAEASHANDIFSASRGKEHLETWKKRSRECVHESAVDMAQYGYGVTATILGGLDYNAKNGADHYHEIDAIDPFKGYPIRNNLQKLAGDPLFRRILSVIKYTAQRQQTLGEDEALAVFSTLVGFAQSYTDHIAKKNDMKKKQKYAMRDTVLMYALYQFDHGIRQYLEVLNSVTGN